MKLILQQQGLWSAVDGRLTANYCSNKVSWEDKRDQALATILLDMQPRLQAKYIEHTDPITLWATLEADLKDASVPERRDRIKQAPASEPPGPPNPEVSIEVSDDVAYSLRHLDWILSTGSSSHFTSRKGIFNTYAAYPEKKTVTTSNGEMLEAVGYGEVTLRIHGQEGGEHKSLTVSAYYVPSLKVNVLSPQQLGHEVEMSDGKWTIKNDDGTAFATGQAHACGAYIVRTGGGGKGRSGFRGGRRGGRRGGDRHGGEEGS